MTHLQVWLVSPDRALPVAISLGLKPLAVALGKINTMPLLCASETLHVNYLQHKCRNLNSTPARASERFLSCRKR